MVFGTEHEREPIGFAERVFLVIFLLVFFGLLCADVFTNFHPLKLGGLFFLGFWGPMLVLHELGHAIVTVLLGWKVERIVIGLGRVLFSFRVGQTKVEIRLLPLEGFVQPVPLNLRLPRLKSALIYFAGPGIELLTLVILVWILGLGQITSRSEDIGMIAIQSLAIVILLSSIVNLVPHGAMTQNGMVANDGLGIIRSFLLPKSYYAEQIAEAQADKSVDS